MFTDKRLPAQHHPGRWKEVMPVTLEELRTLQTARVDKHRTVLIARLAEYGETHLKPLNPKYYRDYYRFLLTLKP